MGATAWTLFHGLAKLGNFALRSFDLVLGDPAIDEGGHGQMQRKGHESFNWFWLSSVSILVIQMMLLVL